MDEECTINGGFSGVSRYQWQYFSVDMSLETTYSKGSILQRKSWRFKVMR